MSRKSTVPPLPLSADAPGHAADRARRRADELVFRQGLAESREQAQRLIMAGKVYVAPPCGKQPDAKRPPQGADQAPCAPSSCPAPVTPLTQPLMQVDKPGRQYRPGTMFVLQGQERFVSRGAYKLLTALEHFHLDVTGFVCLDAGASTGGFTDCLLQHGAARVYAVDVGRAQLHEKLRADARVLSLEGVNLRAAPADLIPEPVDMIVADVSFISLTMVLPACLRWLRPGGLVTGLIKPQFEVGPGQTHKGVVRDEALRQQAVDKVLAALSAPDVPGVPSALPGAAIRLECLGVIAAAIKGPKGNQEYLACWRAVRADGGSDDTMKDSSHAQPERL